MSAHDPPLDPQTGLAPDEAPTPLWLPLLGAALFLVGLTWMAVQATDEPAATSAGQQAPPPTEPAEPEAAHEH